MAKKIAVFTDEKNDLTSFDQDGTIQIFLRRNGEWQSEKSVEVELSDVLSMSELRNKVAQALIVLGDCNIFLARSVTGIPYFELEKAGKTIWELEGQAAQHLEYVFQKNLLEIEEDKLKIIEKTQQLEKLKPRLIEDEHYTVNIAKVQQSDLGITSKQILKPFLEAGNFKSIDVCCSHIPPWLEAQIQLLQLKKDIITSCDHQCESKALKLRITRG